MIRTKAVVVCRTIGNWTLSQHRSNRRSNSDLRSEQTKKSYDGDQVEKYRCVLFHTTCWEFYAFLSSSDHSDIYPLPLKICLTEKFRHLLHITISLHRLLELQTHDSELALSCHKHTTREARPCLGTLTHTCYSLAKPNPRIRQHQRHFLRRPWRYRSPTPS